MRRRPLIAGVLSGKVLCGRGIRQRRDGAMPRGDLHGRRFGNHVYFDGGRSTGYCAPWSAEADTACQAVTSSIWLRE